MMLFRRSFKRGCLCMVCLGFLAVSCFQLGLWSATLSNKSQVEENGRGITVVDFETEIKRSLQGRSYFKGPKHRARNELNVHSFDAEKEFLRQSINSNQSKVSNMERNSSQTRAAFRKKNNLRPDIDKSNSMRSAEIASMEDEQEPQRNRYVKFKGKDNPKMGDFSCLGSVSTLSCTFKVRSVHEAALYCENMGPYCKGFVRGATSKGEHIVYFKNRIGILKHNENTDFFVKKEFYEQVRFKQR